jgi:ribosomal protein S18 acetylase RimI-like enzyme
MDQENLENQENQKNQERKIRTAETTNKEQSQVEKPTKHRVVLKKAEREDVPILAGFLGELFSLEEDFVSDMDKQSRGLMLALDNPDLVDVYKVLLSDKTDYEAGNEPKETAADGGICSGTHTSNEIIGIIVLHKFISTAEGSWTERIEDLYIRPGYRKSGIGTEIIDEVIRLAKEDGLCRIILQADKDNQPALNFYRRYGFEEMNLVSFVIRPE